MISAVLGTCRHTATAHGLHDGHICKDWRSLPAGAVAVDKRWRLIAAIADSAGDTLSEGESLAMLESLTRELGLVLRGAAVSSERYGGRDGK